MPDYRLCSQNYIDRVKCCYNTTSFMLDYMPCQQKYIDIVKCRYSTTSFTLDYRLRSQNILTRPSVIITRPVIFQTAGCVNSNELIESSVVITRPVLNNIHKRHPYFAYVGDARSVLREVNVSAFLKLFVFACSIGHCWEPLKCDPT